MADIIQTKEVLKGYFETGDKPSEIQYRNLIHSLRHVNDKITLQDLNLEGYDEEGERDNSLVIRLGDFVDASNGTKIVLTDDAREVKVSGNLIMDGDINALGQTIKAGTFIGDGSQLTNVPISMPLNVAYIDINNAFSNNQSIIKSDASLTIGHPSGSSAEIKSSATASYIGTVSNSSFILTANNDPVITLNSAKTALFEGLLAHKSGFRVLNKLENGYIDWLFRNTSGSEVKLDLSNIGNATFGGQITANGGIYSTGDIDVAGKVTMDSGSRVGTSTITSLVPTFAVVDTINGGTFTLRGQSPILHFDTTNSGQGKILTDGQPLEIWNGTLDNHDAKIWSVDAGGKMTLFDDLDAKGHNVSADIGKFTSLQIGIDDQSNTRNTIYLYSTNNGVNPIAYQDAGGEIVLNNLSTQNGNFSALSGFNANGLVSSKIAFINKDIANRHGEISIMTHDGSAFAERLKIGTSSVDISADLDVTGTSTFNGPVTLNAENGSGASLTLGRVDTDVFWHINHAGGDFRIYNHEASGSDLIIGLDPASTERQNRLGIGITPTEKLHVNGNGLFNGTVKVEDTLKLGPTTGGNAVNSGTLDFLEDIDNNFGETDGHGFRFTYNGDGNTFNFRSGNDTNTQTIFSVGRDSGEFTLYRETALKGGFENTTSHWYKRSIYNATNGILIETDVDASLDKMIELIIEGNSYFNDDTTGPIISRVQAYNYNATGTIVQTGALSNDPDFTIDIFHYNGKIYFWFEQTGQFQTYSFRTNAGVGSSPVKIVNVTNAAKPTSGVTQNVSITPIQMLTSASISFEDIPDRPIWTWGTARTDITGLTTGSTFGTIYEGISTGHVAVGIRGNDSNDSFWIFETEDGMDGLNTYTNAVMRINNNHFQYKGNDVVHTGNMVSALQNSFLTVSTNQTITGDKTFTSNVTATNFIGNGAQVSNVDATKLDGLDSNRFIYGNSIYGTENTFPTDGGSGANALRRSSFYRDNGHDFGALGIHVNHPTNINYAFQLATTSYGGLGNIRYRLLNNNVWTGEALIRDTVNFVAGTDYVSISGNETISGEKTFADNIRISGTSTGNDNTGAFLFYESNNTTRQGWVGFGSTTNSNMSIYSDVAGSHLRLDANGNLYYNDQEVLDTGNHVAGTDYVSISGNETISGEKTFTQDVNMQIAKPVYTYLNGYDSGSPVIGVRGKASGQSFFIAEQSDSTARMMDMVETSNGAYQRWYNNGAETIRINGELGDIETQELKASQSITIESSNPTMVLKETGVADQNIDIQLNSGQLKIFGVNDARDTFNEWLTVNASNGDLTVKGDLNATGQTVTAADFTGNWNGNSASDFVSLSQLQSWGIGTKAPSFISDLTSDEPGGLYAVTTTTLNQPTDLTSDRGGLLNMRRSGTPDLFQLLIDLQGKTFVRGGTWDGTMSSWIELANLSGTQTFTGQKTFSEHVYLQEELNSNSAIRTSDEMEAYDFRAKNGTENSRLAYFGVEFDRVSNYLRPVSNNDKDLFIGGYGTGTLDWRTINFYAGDSRFYSPVSIEETIKIGGTTTTGELQFFDTSSTPQASLSYDEGATQMVYTNLEGGEHNFTTNVIAPNFVGDWNGKAETDFISTNSANVFTEDNTFNKSIIVGGLVDNSVFPAPPNLTPAFEIAYDSVSEEVKMSAAHGVIAFKDEVKTQMTIAQLDNADAKAFVTKEWVEDQETGYTGTYTQDGFQYTYANGRLTSRAFVG